MFAQITIELLSPICECDINSHILKIGWFSRTFYIHCTTCDAVASIPYKNLNVLFPQRHTFALDKSGRWARIPIYASDRGTSGGTNVVDLFPKNHARK